MTPLVSVILPVFNGEQFLLQAVESILSQTFRDFECIILDDGSTDQTPAILERLEDPRLRVIRQDNQGLIRTLNRGCGLAQGKYLVRMDADDLSSPERIEKQVAYLERNPDIGVVGTWIDVIDEAGNHLRTDCLPLDSFHWHFLFGNCLAHPTVMVRHEAFDLAGDYREGATHVEDYDLWLRMSRFTGLRNLPLVLLKRRLSDGSICARYAEEQQATTIAMMRGEMSGLLGRVPDLGLVRALRRFLFQQPLCRAESVAVGELILMLFRALNEPRVALDAGRRLCVLAVRAWPSPESLRLLQMSLQIRGDVPLQVFGRELVYRGLECCKRHRLSERRY